MNKYEIIKSAKNIINTFFGPLYTWNYLFRIPQWLHVLTFSSLWMDIMAVTERILQTLINIQIQKRHQQAMTSLTHR